MVGMKGRCSNFLKCIKTLVETVKEEEVQQILERLTILQNEIKVA